MKMSKEKRALIAGMIGCLLYVIGDFLFAATGKSHGDRNGGFQSVPTDSICVPFDTKLLSAL